MKNARSISRAFARRLVAARRREAAVDVAARDDEAEQAVAPARDARRRSCLKDAGLLEVVADAERERVEEVLAEARAADCGASGGGQEEAPVRRDRVARGRSRAGRVGSDRRRGVTAGETPRRRPPGPCARSCSRRAGGACGRDRPSRWRSPRGIGARRAATRPFCATKPPPSKTRPSLAPTRFAYATVHWLSAARVAIISRRVSATPRRKGEAERLQTISAPA